jgi:Fe-S-cluster-containing dehydrogenase component/CRP-like cAMP-binding protein
MSEVHLIEQPRRWDLPFSLDLPDPADRRDMTDADLARLMSVEPFAHMDAARFPKRLPLEDILRNDTRICRYNQGDVVVRQGDYGHSAFLILDGNVRVILGLDPNLIGRPERRGKSLLRSVASLFTKSKAVEARDAKLYPQMQQAKAQATAHAAQRVLVQDMTSTLKIPFSAVEKLQKRSMGPGEVFGELAALGRIPRTATVIADDQATLLEIRWQGLRDLRKYDEALQDHIDAQFRRFGLADALWASPMLAQLSVEDAERVAETAEFETYGSYDWYGSYQQLRKKDADPLANEPIIAEQGHDPNGLILIHAGFARLSRRYGNGERTISYLGKGGIYGLDELANNAGRNQPAPLSTTLGAIGYVDIVRIPTRTFEQIILPRIPKQMLAAEPERPVPTPRRSKTKDRGINPAMMEFLVENRFINGTATMIIDMDRCTRCDDCVRACADGHDNNPRFVRHGPIFDRFMVANACMHCVDPVCLIGCPTGAIHRFEEGGEVVLNDITCIGCGVCAASCPYDNIRMVQVRQRTAGDVLMVDPAAGKPIVKATKCDLCVDHHGGPACQRACPHDAMMRIDMRNDDLLADWLKR